MRSLRTRRERVLALTAGGAAMKRRGSVGRTIVIGIDCATEDDRTGVARGTVDGARCRVDLAKLASDLGPLANAVDEWTREANRVLIAIDSPLGWPTALGKTLAMHSAGEPISYKADELFARACDHFVRDELDKKPLEVGADRIARTARRALELLAEIGSAMGHRVELAWKVTFETRVAAIEVYPAATLRALGARNSGYKRDGVPGVRAEILQ